jgi:hypothetical protein
VVTLKLTWEMQDRLPATNRDSLALPEKWGPGPFSNTFPSLLRAFFKHSQSDIATAPIQLALLSDATTSTVHHGGGVSGRDSQRQI